MNVCQHIRRWDPQSKAGQLRLRCDCGWEGHAPTLDDDRPRSRVEVEGELETAFLEHLRPEERRTYLLLDTREPTCRDSDARIMGNFVMPEGEAVLLLSARRRAGVHYGTFQLGNEPPAELPIGEVRTPDGRVFRLDQ